MNPLPDWFFDVFEAPVEAVFSVGESPRRVRVPSKKAIVAQDTGRVLGVVGKDYFVVTNKEALNLCLDLCQRAFPDSKSCE